MAPTWLTVVAWTYIGVCIICAGLILYDIVVARRRQSMGVMNWVFPITALYFGPFALAFYRRWARADPRPRAPSPPATDAAEARMPAAAAVPEMAMAASGRRAGTAGFDAQGSEHTTVTANPRQAEAARQRTTRSDRPHWVTIAIETSHCGSGCTLGDFISEWIVFAFAITIAGYAIFAEYLGDYLLAVTLGIVFQYFAIAPMRGLGVKDGLKAAAKADVISLTFFEIGLFAWMAVMTFVFFPAPNNLMPSSIAFWFLMQIGMIIGYFTSWPANVWLVKRGIKLPM